MSRRGMLGKLHFWRVPMSLRFRLIGLVSLALVISLVLGGATAWVNASRSVRTEMRSALLVGRQTIESGIERLQQAADPSRGLDELVASFKGNRHLRVWFAGQAEAVATPIVESPPFGVVPNWFVRVIRVAPVTDRVPIIIGGRDYGTIALERVEAVTQRGDDHLQAVAYRGDGSQSQTTAFGLQGLDQLPAAGRQGVQQIVANHAAAPAAPAQLVREKGENQPGIDGVGLGFDAAALAEGNDIVGMNPDKADATLAQSLDQDALMAAGRLKGRQPRANPIEPGRHGLGIIGDPLDPGAAGNTNVQPPLGDIDPDNRLVSHALVPQNCKTPWLVGTPDCMRARAQSTVRVSDRDAGGSEMATVVKTYPRTECPLASPSHRWRNNNAIHVFGAEIEPSSRRGCAGQARAWGSWVKNSE